MRIYDISVPIGAGTPVYTGDPPISITPKSSIAAGDSANVSTLKFGSHTGTHIDAPFHFNPQGEKIDQLPLNTFIGPAQVIEVPAQKGYVTPEEILEAGLDKNTRRLLLKTPNCALWQSDDFTNDFVYLCLEAAQLLLESGIRLVGTDYLSIEKFHSYDHAVHRLLLENSIIILEGINLSEVPPGFYQLICPPLKIKDGDGSPARALLTAPSDSVGP